MYSALHNHSEFSLLDGYGTPKEMLDRAQEVGLNAFAVTEHGTMYSALYYDIIKKDYPSIKVIYGCELYECQDRSVKDKDNKYFHLICLVRNEQGRKDLNKVITKSNFEGFYFKPRCTIDDIKPYAENFVITSACLAGKLARESDFDKCVEYINEYKEAFPYFYLEMQSHSHEEQCIYNRKILELSKRTNTPFVITTDSHAAKKEDLYYQDKLVKIGRNSSNNDKTAIENTEIYEGCYIQTEEEIHECMDSQIGYENVCLGLSNTNDVADLIKEVHMPFQSPQLPTFPLPEGFADNYEFLCHLVRKGWEDRGFDRLDAEQKSIYSKRLKYELEVIHSMKFDGYFLFVWDFIKAAEKLDIEVGKGRGCFAPDTKVLLANGQTKNIQDIQVGDNVITHLGNIKPVLNVFEYDCNETMYSIKAGETEPIICTDNHQIYAYKTPKCYRTKWNTEKIRKYCTPTCSKYNNCIYKTAGKLEWIEAQELEMGDYIVLPKHISNIQKNIVFDLVKYGDENLKYDDKYIWYCNPLTDNISKNTRLNRYIYLNDDFIKLSGWFISQGWHRYNEENREYSIGFAHHCDKNDLINENIQILDKVFGKNIGVSKHKSRNVVQVMVYSKVLAKFFETLFGSYATNKHIPNELMNLDKHQTEILIRSLWDGDGNYKIGNKAKTKYSTINYNLAKQVQCLLSKIDVVSYISKRVHKNKENWHDEHSVTVYGINNISKLNRICGDAFINTLDLNRQTHNSKTWVDDKYIYSKIQSISTMEYNGKVYDLQVKDDTSYIVGSMAVHNSAAGSLVCYCCHITDIDPIKYGLIFERFLNPERVGLPDIDTDVGDRDAIIDYLVNKYGEDRVCQIINFSYITPCVAVTDVGRILGFQYNQMQKLSQKFTLDKWEDCMKSNPTLLLENPQYAELFDICSHLSGRLKTVSIHAGGIGIVDTNVNDYMPMKIGKKGEHVIQVDKHYIEAIGIVKFDLLGLATLNLVKEIKNDLHLNPWDYNINNPKFEKDKITYELLASGRTNGVFQVESAGMKDLLVRLKPKLEKLDFEVISVVLALYRPDSMGALDEYVEMAITGKRPPSIHPDMDKILQDTNYCMIYQEQLLDIVRVFGGRSYGKADLFRKAIGKKLPELVKQESDKLRDEIVENDYTKEIADKISNELSTKGNYLFNKSHSYSYAVLCFETAWFKAHYPTYFFKALFNQNKDKAGALNKYILDAKYFNVDVEPPNINDSKINFTVKDNKVLFGLSAISGIGETLSNEIIQERETNGRFKSFDDLIQRVPLTKAQVIALIKAGAIPCKDKKARLIKYLKSQYKPLQFKEVASLPSYKRLEEEWRINLKEYILDTKGKRITYDKEALLKEYNRLKKEDFEIMSRERFQKYIDDNKKYLENKDFWEFETLQVFINNNPFDDAYNYLMPFEDVQIGEKCTLVGVIAKVQKKKDKNGKQFAFINIYSSFGLIEGVLWHTQLRQYEDLVKKGQQIAILCVKDKEENVVINRLKPYDKWLEEIRAKGVMV